MAHNVVTIIMAKIDQIKQMFGATSICPNQSNQAKTSVEPSIRSKKDDSSGYFKY